MAKRSSCTSGSGNVPWKSRGFCVAITKKGRGDGAGHTVGADLTFFHHLEQRRLGLGAAAVDLVADEHVGEHRTLTERERAAALIEHHHAGDVGGQQVGRELHPLPATGDRVGDRLGETGLAGSRHVVEQQVALGEQAAQRQTDLVAFAAHDPVDVVDHRVGDVGDLAGRKARWSPGWLPRPP